MDLSILLQVALAGVFTFMFERIKNSPSISFISPYTDGINKVFSALVALGIALGITTTWVSDPETGRGTFTLSGIPLTAALWGEVFVRAFGQYWGQKLIYHATIKETPPNLGKYTGLLLALVIATAPACAKGQHLQVERTVRTIVVTAANTVEPLVCDPAMRKMLGSKEPCEKLLNVLEPAVDAAIEYNRALRNGALPDIAKTVEAIQKLVQGIRDIVPAGKEKDAALADLAAAELKANGGR